MKGLPVAELADEDEDAEYEYRFDPEVQAAYCKYCYRTHDDWRKAEDHDLGCWTCELCDHTSHEDYMKIYPLTEAQNQNADVL